MAQQTSSSPRASSWWKQSQPSWSYSRGGQGAVSRGGGDHPQSSPTLAFRDWRDTQEGKIQKCEQQEKHKREVLNRALERRDRIRRDLDAILAALAAADADLSVRRQAVDDAAGATKAARVVIVGKIEENGRGRP